MKKMIVAVALLFGATVIAQDVKPEFEKNGDAVKGTFFYEDGTVKQVGTYKDGKLHGEWTMYTEDGEKQAIAQYQNGEKVGKWFFWNDDQLTEVDYSDSKITAVTKWENTNAVVSK